MKGPKLRGVVIVTRDYLCCKEIRAYMYVVKWEGSCNSERTRATWFSHYQDDDIRSIARIVMEHLEQQRWSRAHDECARQVNHVFAAGHCCCFIGSMSVFGLYYITREGMSRPTDPVLHVAW